MSRLFKDGMEMRLTHEDILNAIHYWLNKHVMSYNVDDVVVNSLTLHHDTKYAARITLSRPLPQIKKIPAAQTEQETKP